MSVQNINEYLKEVCGITASNQFPKTRSNRLVIKKSLIGCETTEVSLPIYDSITFYFSKLVFHNFFSHKQKSKSELTILLPGKNEKAKLQEVHKYIICSTSNHTPPVIIKCKWFQINIL